MTTSTLDRKSSKSLSYQITIEGQIRDDWSDWLNGMEISTPPGGDVPQVTNLTGAVADQAALRGLLCRLWDMNLTIISIIRLDANAGTKEGLK